MRSKKTSSWQLIALTTAALCMSLNAQECAVEGGNVLCSVKLNTSWVVPSEREDGSALLPAEISKYQLVALAAANITDIPGQDVAQCDECFDIEAIGSSVVIDRSISLTKADVVDDGIVSLAVAIRTFDTSFKVSKWSDLVYTDLNFPPEIINELVPPVKKTQLIKVEITFE